MRWMNLLFMSTMFAGTVCLPQHSAARGPGLFGVQGTVVDDAGQPVARVKVRIAIVDSWNAIEEGSLVRTDDAGAFRFSESPTQVKALSGLVAGPHGQSIKGAVIKVMYDANVHAQPNHEFRVDSDATGAFRLQRLPTECRRIIEFDRASRA